MNSSRSERTSSFSLFLSNPRNSCSTVDRDCTLAREEKRKGKKAKRKERGRGGDRAESRRWTKLETSVSRRFDTRQKVWNSLESLQPSSTRLTSPCLLCGCSRREKWRGRRASRRMSCSWQSSEYLGVYRRAARYKRRDTRHSSYSNIQR